MTTEAGAKEGAAGSLQVSGFRSSALHCAAWLDEDAPLEAAEEMPATQPRTAMPGSKGRGFTARLQRLFNRDVVPRLPPSAADASALAGAAITSEDDVLHLRSLENLWSYLLPMATFTNTFFLSQAYGF